MYDDILQRLEAVEIQLSKMNVRGTISEIDPERGPGGCVRVLYGDEQLSGWLPVKPFRTGKAIVWWFPEVGEAVTVTDIDGGEVLPGSYTKDIKPPTRDPDKFHVEFGDGSKVVHDRNSGKLDVVNIGDVEVTTQQNLTINAAGDVTVNAEGNVSVKSSAKDIQLNGGAGVVTGAHICQFTGKPHSDCSAQVKAGK